MDTPPRRKSPALARLATYAFVAVPAVGLLELAAELVQEHGAAPLEDFAAARAVVQKDLKADDLVLFAPSWDDPVGRETFGNDIMTLERSAFPDVTRYPRAYEIAIRGAERPEVADWKVVHEEKTGKVTVRLRENPHPEHVLTDLVSLTAPGPGLTVTRSAGGRGDDGAEHACEWTHGMAQTGGLGFGPAVPGDRANCPGNAFVGVTVLPALDYSPRRGIEATPTDGGGTHLQFHNVAFGQKIHGHHGIYVEQERGKTGAPVTLVFAHDGQTLGRAVHLDGMGWAGFDIATPSLGGQKGDLDVFVTSPEGGRKYVFEADTR